MLEVHYDKSTDLKYIDGEDILDEKKFDLTEKEVEYLANSTVVDYIHEIQRKIISLFLSIEFFKDDSKTFVEKMQLKEKISNLYFDLDFEYQDSLDNDGIWKYIKFDFNHYCSKYEYIVSAKELFETNYLKPLFKEVNDESRKRNFK